MLGAPRSPASPAPAAPESASSPVAARGSRSPANPPSCRSRSGPAEGRRYDSPPLPLPASVSPRTRRRRLPSSRLPLDSTAAAAPPSPATLADRSPKRPWPLGGMGLGSPGDGDQSELGGTGAAAAPPCPGAVSGLSLGCLGPQPTTQASSKHSSKVVCYLFEGWGYQIQPRISPKLALVSMASLSSLSLFKESSRTFSNRHTHTKTSLSGTHMSTRWEGFSFSLTCSLLRYLCQAMA